MVESAQASACEALATKTFIIHSNPEPAFEIDGLACINEAFSLINNTTNAVSYQWNFGDGNQSNAENPTHTYTTQGTYDLALIATSEFGCTASISESLYITTPPTAMFTVAEDEGCAPFEVQVNNTSSGDDLTQWWTIAGDSIPGPDLVGIFLDSITKDSFFTIQLNVANQCGLRTDEAQVLVRPYPLVNFGINQDEGCSPSIVDVSNTTLGNPDQFLWQTNNQTFTDSILPTQIYTTGDTSITVYPITLIASNECGIDTLTKEITVFPPNVEAFIQQDTLRGCPPLSISMESFATPGATATWEIFAASGNAVGGHTGPILLDTLTEPGFYEVILYASNCGTDTDTAYVEVLPTTTVAFEAPPIICIGDTIPFSNTSVDISRSEWDFDDGQSSTLRSPTHVFDRAGVYQVSLTGYSTINNCPVTYTQEVRVVGNPVARFAPSVLNGCWPLTIDFTNQSEGFSDLRYVWDFGDGSSNSFAANPSHTFTEAGNFSVRLQVVDDHNCFADTSIVNIFVYGPPVSQFSINQESFCLGYDTVQLTNTSVEAVRYEWTMAGNTFTTANLDYLPLDPGSLAIQLIVENQFGCRDTSNQVVEVLPAPLAAFRIDEPAGCQEHTIQINNQSSFANRYSWDLAEGNVSTDDNPSHTFINAGQFTILLTASSDNGCPSDTSQAMVTVFPTPVASFTLQKEDKCGTPNEVVLTNTTVGGQDYQWTFSNGFTSTLTDVNYSFEDPGQYRISMQAENEFGCTDQAIDSVTIFGLPMADFDVSIAQGCEDLEVTLMNFSTESRRYRWTVTSLPPIYEANPTIVLPDPGTYDVKLVAIYSEACQDSVVVADAITVYESPIADFAYQADTDKAILGDVQYFNRSLLFDRLLWDFGDSTQSTALDPFHVYDINRPLTATLVAFNDNNGQFTCPDTLQKPVDPEWITTFFSPNAFAPEYSDSKVGVFQPVGIGIQSYDIRVYSKWGGLVWSSKALENTSPTGYWNGRLNNEGAILPQGAYTWVATLQFVNGAPRTYRGTVTLLR